MSSNIKIERRTFLGTSLVTLFGGAFLGSLMKSVFGKKDQRKTEQLSVNPLKRVQVKLHPLAIKRSQK